MERHPQSTAAGSDSSKQAWPRCRRPGCWGAHPSSPCVGIIPSSHLHARPDNRGGTYFLPLGALPGKKRFWSGPGGAARPRTGTWGAGEPDTTHLPAALLGCQVSSLVKGPHSRGAGLYPKKGRFPEAGSLSQMFGSTGASWRAVLGGGSWSPCSSPRQPGPPLVLPVARASRPQPAAPWESICLPLALS